MTAVAGLPTPRTDWESGSRLAAAKAFELGDDNAYRRWRERKLRDYPESAADITVDIAALTGPTHGECSAMRSAIERANMCRYRWRNPSSDAARSRAALSGLARTFGLARYESHPSAGADGLVALEMAEGGRRSDYIPYTNRPLGWHTDGYYRCDGPDGLIRSVVLHCHRPAGEGGENGWLDHEIAYIRLRDADPDLIGALMHPAAMTIPADAAGPESRHRPSIGPVFAVDGAGRLAMRFSARKRNVAWRDDAKTRAAAAMLDHVLAEEPLVLRFRLDAGEGVIGNNVLHHRLAFAPAAAGTAGRLLYRLRSYDCIATGDAAP